MVIKIQPSTTDLFAVYLPKGRLLRAHFMASAHPVLTCPDIGYRALSKVMLWRQTLMTFYTQTVGKPTLGIRKSNHWLLLYGAIHLKTQCCFSKTLKHSPSPDTSRRSLLFRFAMFPFNGDNYHYFILWRSIA